MKAKTCPICRRPRVAEHAPFCSSRCKDRDLLRWLDQGYAVPGPPTQIETGIADLGTEE